MEFACNGEVLINDKVIDHIQRLQRFRDWYLRPMPINSGYRTAEHNSKVGGSPNSQHLKGIACDIALPKEFFKMKKARQDLFLSNIKAKWLTLGNGTGGVGFYDTFFHLDSRQAYSFWDERK